MSDLCLVVVINGHRCVVERRQHICLDVPYLRCVVMDAVQNILDMSIVQLHEPALHNFRWPVLSGAPDRLRRAADCINQQIQDFINASVIIGIALLQVILRM